VTQFYQLENHSMPKRPRETVVDTSATAAADRRSTPSIPLAGGSLGPRRHVCALFAGPDEADAVLGPFIADGLRQGQRILLLVGPVEHDGIDRLLPEGIDVDKATEKGLFEVASWQETYLRGGAFQPMGMLLHLQKRLNQSRWRGFPATRAIGFMEWALGLVDGAAALTIYERDLDLVLRGGADVVICAYDLSRQPAGIVVEAQATHPVSVIRGELVSTGTSISPRDRILDAASVLFSRQGVAQTGVDAVIDSAAVAKATFYRHFPSKSQLVLAWLADTRTRWLDRVRRRAEEITGGSGVTIPAVFQALGEWLEAEDFQGCGFRNTAAELVGPDHPARRLVGDYLAEERAFLTEILASSGHPDPDRLAGPIQTLLSGAISLSVARRDAGPVQDARRAALGLLGPVN